MPRVLAYPLVLLSVIGLLAGALVLNEMDEANWTHLNQPAYWVNAVVLACLLTLALSRLAPWPRLRSSVQVAVICAASLVLPYVINRTWTSSSFERDALVSQKAMVGKIHHTSHQGPRRWIPTLWIAAAHTPGRAIAAPVDSTLWNRVQPHRTQVRVQTRFGITGIEFAEVLGVLP